MATLGETKRRRYIKDHGLDFAGCESIWDNFTITREDIRHAYGEKRLVTFGLLEGDAVVMVHTERRAGLHISLYARRENMKRAITVKLPKTTSNKRVDPDNPPWSEEMLGAPVLRRGRGPQKSPTKVLTTARLDADVMAFFKSQGQGYQTRINEELRKVVAKGLTTGARRTQKRAA